MILNNNMRTNRTLSEKTKQKISLSLTGVKNPNYGKSLSYEHRNKISQSMKEYWKGIPL